MSVNLDLQDALAALDDARHEDQDDMVANALLKVGVAYNQRSRWALAQEALDEARYLCRKLENPLGLAQVDLRMAESCLGTGQLDAAQELLEEAEAIYRAEEDRPGLMAVMERLADLHGRADRPERALGYLDQILAEAEAAGDQVSQLLVQQYRAPLLRRLDRLPQALSAYRRLGELSHQADDPQRVALALVGVGTLQVQLGRPEVGLAALDEAARVFESLGMVQRANQVRAERQRLAQEPPSA